MGHYKTVETTKLKLQKSNKISKTITAKWNEINKIKIRGKLKSKIKNHITYTGTRIYGFAHKSVHTKHNICSCIKRPTRTKKKITRQGGKGGEWK